jgi:uncharacterized membrane protein
MPIDFIWHAIIILAALGGFILAFYIRHKKLTHEKMVCPIGSDCDAVIHSEYSIFLGIPVEIIGLFYYGLIAVNYTLFLIFPWFAPPFIVFGVFVLTIAAFLFSLYLTFIQAFTLKQWCTWCLMSAGICTLIFATAISISEFGFVPLLERYYQIILIGHLLGLALGLGGATITDIFFFKFLKDFRISEWEVEILHTLSQVIWFALAILVLTGLGLYLTESKELSQSAKFLVKMIVVAVIIVNGAFLNLLIAPKLVKISFGEKHKHETGELHYIRKIAFMLGAISIVSWYSAFILGMLQRPPTGFLPLLSIYIFILIVAIVGSQFMEQAFIKRANSTNNH